MDNKNNNNPTLKPLPLPNFEVNRNSEIASNVGNKKDDVNISAPRVARGVLNTFTVQNGNLIEDNTQGIERGVASFSESSEEAFIEAYGHIGQLPGLLSVYTEPRAPIMFPQAEDAIKSLNFSAASKDSDVVNGVTEYYQTVINLMRGQITADEYYAKMPSLVEKIKDFTLNETDWETLRDSILRVQRYIVNYMWEDMQKISRAMDDGFKEYQRQLNNWIAEANRYYASDEFIPGGAVMLDHFGRGANKFKNDTYQIQQNVKYLLDGMCTQISKTKPTFNMGVTEDREKYPDNKQMVWIEELNI